MCFLSPCPCPCSRLSGCRPESVSAYGGSVLTFPSPKFSTARLSCSFKSAQARPRRNDARGVLGESYGHGWLTVSSTVALIPEERRLGAADRPVSAACIILPTMCEETHQVDSTSRQSQMIIARRDRHGEGFLPPQGAGFQ